MQPNIYLVNSRQSGQPSRKPWAPN